MTPRCVPVAPALTGQGRRKTRADPALPAPTTTPVLEHPTPALSCRGLARYRDGRSILERVDLDVPTGTLHTVVAADPRALDALIEVVCGLATPDVGTVILGSGAPGTMSAERLREVVGLARCDARVSARSTTQQCLSLWARLLHVGRPVRAARVHHVLTLTDLLERKDEALADCPAGVLRQLGIAVALLHRPRLIVLDRIAEGLDQHEREQIARVVERMLAAGHAVLDVTLTASAASPEPDRTTVLTSSPSIPAVFEATSAQESSAEPFAGSAPVLIGTGG